MLYEVITETNLGGITIRDDMPEANADVITSYSIHYTKLYDPALSGLSQISPSLAVTGYNMNMSLDASSIFWGVQVGASYAFNDVISGYVGLRLVPA